MAKQPTVLSEIISALESFSLMAAGRFNFAFLRRQRRFNLINVFVNSLNYKQADRAAATALHSAGVSRSPLRSAAGTTGRRRVLHNLTGAAAQCLFELH